MDSHTNNSGMNRDAAVRAVARVMRNDLTCMDSCAIEHATVAVDALIAAGWGDLAAERERLAARVEDLHLGCRDGEDERHDALDAAARLIRETPDSACNYPECDCPGGKVCAP